MNKEIWKDIQGYEGLYQVSNLGNVRSLVFKNKNSCFPRIKNIKIQTSGKYNHIILRKDNKPKNYLIHRLVANAFIPNPNNYKEVNHIDENTRNNNANNLEWCNHKYNINYGNRTKKAKSKVSIAIEQYDLKHNLVKEWNCMNDAIRYYNNKHIFDVCKGKRKMASGYLWKYKEGEIYG